MRKRIREFIKRCPFGQRNKIVSRTPKEPMSITTTVNKVFEKIFLDIMRPLSRSYQEKSYILTLQNDLTKFA